MITLLFYIRIKCLKIWGWICENLFEIILILILSVFCCCVIIFVHHETDDEINIRQAMEHGHDKILKVDTLQCDSDGIYTVRYDIIIKTK